jgi:hypothetical protein
MDTGRFLSSNVKIHIYNSIHDRKQQIPGDCETYVIPRISMYQLYVGPQNLQYTTTNPGHETQAWYDRYREIHEVMGVQVNSEMPKMWIPL